LQLVKEKKLFFGGIQYLNIYITPNAKSLTPNTLHLSFHV